MATTTPNFGWVVPTSTDLVKDGATAIETLGDSIDATLLDLKGGTTGQVLKKNSGTDMDFVWGADSAGMTNPMTTTGDIIYSSSGSTPARLGIGTTGQVLNVTAGVPAWATPAGADANWTLLNSGGTTLSGSQTITVSGISGKDKILILMDGASISSANSAIRVRFNTDTNSNYYTYGGSVSGLSSYSASIVGRSQGATNGLILSYLGSNATATGAGYVMLTGCNTAGVKAYTYGGGSNTGGGGDQGSYFGGGYYNSSSTISSISLNGVENTFDAGTVFVYTA
jgi:hypothetical protein